MSEVVHLRIIIIIIMAKNGNASAIMKELLSNFFKYANPILNTVLGFKATGSRLCMWLWTLCSDSAYSSFRESDIVIHVLTSHDSHQYASGSRCESFCACELSRGDVICERAPTTPVYHRLI